MAYSVQTKEPKQELSAKEMSQHLVGTRLILAVFFGGMLAAFSEPHAEMWIKFFISAGFFSVLLDYINRQGAVFLQLEYELALKWLERSSE